MLSESWSLYKFTVLAPIKGGHSIQKLCFGCSDHCMKNVFWQDLLWGRPLIESDLHWHGYGTLQTIILSCTNIIRTSSKISQQFQNIIPWLLWFDDWSQSHSAVPKVLCNPHYGNSHLEMVVCKWKAPHCTMVKLISRW